MTYQPCNLLVTGGAGFIGANFIRYVLAHEPNIKIINLDKLTYAGSLQNLENLPHAHQHTFVQGDIQDALLIKNLLEMYQIDTIVHFAAESHVDRSIKGPSDFVGTNIIGTFTLLEEARKFKLQRFHHISTDEVFGTLQKNDPAFVETTPYSPRSPYSATKASSDHLVNAYYHTYNLPITISNCSNNYGPYQHTEKLIPTIIYSCLNQQRIPIYGNGKNIRDWLYVEDHCDGIWKIIKNGKIGDSYNIGGDNEWENIKLARYICDQLDKIYPQAESHNNLLSYITDRPGHDFRYAIDSTKLKTTLDWKPHKTFAEGLTHTIEFYAKKLKCSNHNHAVTEK